MFHPHASLLGVCGIAEAKAFRPVIFRVTALTVQRVRAVARSGAVEPLRARAALEARLVVGSTSGQHLLRGVH